MLTYFLIAIVVLLFIIVILLFQLPDYLRELTIAMINSNEDFYKKFEGEEDSVLHELLAEVKALRESSERLEKKT